MILSILTITNKKHKFVNNFLNYNCNIAKQLSSEFVVAYDRCDPIDIEYEKYSILQIECSNKNIVEEKLKYCHSRCLGRYVMRLDDDEILDNEAIAWVSRWIKNPKYRTIGFSRYNLWNNINQFIADTYPDVQTRLMIKSIENRRTVHEGLPSEIIAKGNILHYKFLIKSCQERLEIAKNYENNSNGAGFGDYLIHNIPEQTNFNIKTIDYNSITNFNFF